MVLLWIIGGLASLVALAFLLGITVVKEWEKLIVFNLGKFSAIKEPGLNFVFPLIQRGIIIDTRERAVDVKPQEIMSSDNVPATIDAVVYYKIVDAKKAILEIEDYAQATGLLAQSALQTVMRKKEFNEFLLKKEECGNEILDKLQKPTDAWGITITKVEIKNIAIPDNLKRAMAKEAEAIREKKSRIIKAEGELESSKKLVEAGKMLAGDENAILLRQLQTWQEIGAEQNSLIILVPTNFKEAGMDVAMSSAIEKVRKNVEKIEEKPKGKK
jgi:regulator of protease activity HflC (stomatin/prohibitin superfamily)